MRTEIAQGGLARAAAAGAAILLFGDERHRPVETDGENILEALEIGEGALMLDERPVAAKPGQDRLTGLGMTADLARQRQQLERELEIDIVGLHALGQGGAGRLLAVLALSELDIGAEAAVLQGHRQAGLGIIAEKLAFGGNGAFVLAIPR